MSGAQGQPVWLLLCGGSVVPKMAIRGGMLESALFYTRPVCVSIVVTATSVTRMYQHTLSRPISPLRSSSVVCKALSILRRLSLS